MKIIVLIFVLLLSQISLCLAIDTIKVNEKDALFTAYGNTSPIISTKYLGWKKNWKWAGVKLKTSYTAQDGQYKSSHFTGQIKNLGITFNGDVSLSPQKKQLYWSYTWDKSENISDSIGFGIEFKLQLNHSSFASISLPPELLADNKGWRWKTPDGQVIEVSFSPPLAKLYFERKQKNIIRAFFFSEVISGTQQSTMTVKVNKNIEMTGPDALNYEPLNATTWDKDILPVSSSPIDLSFLNKNDIPAGKHGFVQRTNEQLSFSDGTPIKFWGANIQAYTLFKTSDQNIKKHAKRIAQLGFNLIRIHHHDSAWVKPNIFKHPSDNTLELSSSALKKLDWWVKCLRDEGIYLWLDLHVGRTFTKNDGLTNFDDFSKQRETAEARGFNYYNNSIQSAMQAFNEAYLTHVNQFTNLAYKDDPAIFALLITNENDLTRHFGNKLLANKGVPTHNTIFTEDVKKFSNTFNLPYKKTLRTWKAGASKIYLNDTEHRFNETMLSHLAHIGTKSLVATTSSWGRMGLYSLPSLTDGSIIDAHSYGKAEELNYNPRYNPIFLTWIGAAQVTGYPLSVTEWNIEPFPARDRFIAPIFTASIASLQGWDALMLFGYSQAPLGNFAKGSNYSSYNDPAIMGLMPAAALLYRQDHVALANTTYELTLDRNNFFFTNNDPNSSKTIRTLLETSRLTIAMPKTPELPWLDKHIYTNPNAIPITNSNKDFIPANQSYVTSDTGELTRSWDTGIHTINTKKSQIISGWVGNKPIQLDSVLFKIKTKKAVIAVQSLENKAITNSKKIFITLMAQSHPTGKNSLPFLSEPIIGDIYIKAPAGLQLYPVMRSGALAPSISISYIKGQYIIPLSLTNKYHWAILQP